MNPALRELVDWLVDQAIAEVIAVGVRAPSATITEPTPQPQPPADHDRRRHLRQVQLRSAESGFDR